MKTNPFVPTYQDVLISTITIPEDHRGLDEAKVAPLADSIQETGLLQPVGLTRDFRLVYGRHRLAAYEKLGYQSIPAIILDYETDLLFELATLDENLQRNVLTALEENLALARRKEIFEKLHPETKAVTKRGGPGRGKNKRQNVARFFYGGYSGQNWHNPPHDRAQSRDRQEPRPAGRRNAQGHTDRGRPSGAEGDLGAAGRGAAGKCGAA